MKPRDKMSKLTAHHDGVLDLVNNLANIRNTTSNSMINARRTSIRELQQVFHTGLGRKIIDIKVGRALRDTLNFDKDDTLKIYNQLLYKHVKHAMEYMLAFGRGIIVLRQLGDDLSKPITSLNIKKLSPITFGGDTVVALGGVIDLNDSRYMQPTLYQVNGAVIHPSRVIDFSYYRPSEEYLPEYQYGGISEFELIYDQLVNDGIVERASVTGLNKNSIPTIKVKDFKQLCMQKKEGDMLRYFGAMENAASIYGSRLIDADDDIFTTQQTLTNLVQADLISIRRLSMVSQIPQAWLIGESVKGLNATGEFEQNVFQDMIERLQENFLIEPINRLLSLCNLGVAEFKDNQGVNPLKRIEFETKVLENARKLKELGRDEGEYLKEYGLDFKTIKQQEPEDKKEDKVIGVGNEQENSQTA
jgi:hypothetical protein